jgi:hypothetical protein
MGLRCSLQKWNNVFTIGFCGLSLALACLDLSAHRAELSALTALLLLAQRDVIPY